MSHLVNVRCPNAKSKKQAIACFAFTDTCRVANITSRYDGKPCRANDLDGGRETDTVQIRYAADRKVAVVTMREVAKAKREDLPMLEQHFERVFHNAALDVYRECVIALDCLDAGDDAPHRWRDRLPLYAIATRQHRAAIDLGDLEERPIAKRARDAAFRGVIACE